MTSKKKQVAAAYDGFKVLALPYKQGEDRRCFTMYFLLPDAKDGLPALVEKMGSEPGFLDRHLPFQEVKVGEFRIPRFKMSFGFEASNILKGLGLVLPFSHEGGGLTEMVDSPVGQYLYVSAIFHKSFIEVNEEGTEAAAAAAAASVAVMMGASRYSTNIDFVADHPFIFMIREDMTGVVLFIGHLHNPLQVRMVARIVEGDVGKAICKESNRLKPAALVMDGYQRQRFIPKGSVSEYCFHNCKSAPVIIVPEKEAKEESVI
ncbi:hypothetical protein HHK36_010027 [Tetracentron sinense]|uniref:Serpin domain-containing protein n=1 Tax=Tetracentron sinense TaxID=13715 RepID=A0A834ZBU0_TETSI|nr:hypothetical protein HHK36_010027 [Tetracentron sinense]